MSLKTLCIRLRSLSLTLAVVLFFTIAWAADHQTVLYAGVSPVGNLLMDSAGNLYGATSFDGRYGLGTVFELSRAQEGGWSETVLHDFNSGEPYPNGSLIMDAAGNLYGTTALTAFELSPNPDGTWTENVLCVFGTDSEGLEPDGGLLRDAAGNLYGVTLTGGGDMQGTVFEIVHGSEGWYEFVVYNFGIGNDGKEPIGNLVMDSAGNLFGTTYAGGDSGAGTVFEVTGSTETTLHSFSGSDGNEPRAGLVMDAAGNLFGTTRSGGDFGLGVVFEVSPVAGGGWTETTVYSFSGRPDGENPESSLTFDTHGNLYGTTLEGGFLELGTAFELSPRQGGWSETVLYSFEGSGDGELPSGGLIRDRAGDLYGAASNLVYELTSPSICGVHCPSATR